MRYNKDVPISKIGTIIDYKEVDNKIGFTIRVEDEDYDTKLEYDASFKSYICRDAILEITKDTVVIKQIIM